MQHNGTLYAFNNTFIAGDNCHQFLSANAAGASMVARNNIFFGSDLIAIAGEAFEVQRATYIAGGLWVPLVTAILGTGVAIQVTDINAMEQPMCFYRLRWTAIPLH